MPINVSKYASVEKAFNYLKEKIKIYKSNDLENWNYIKGKKLIGDIKAKKSKHLTI